MLSLETYSGLQLETGFMAHPSTSPHVKWMSFLLFTSSWLLMTSGKKREQAGLNVEYFGEMGGRDVWRRVSETRPTFTFLASALCHLSTNKSYEDNYGLTLFPGTVAVNQSLDQWIHISWAPAMMWRHPCFQELRVQRKSVKDISPPHGKLDN